MIHRRNTRRCRRLDKHKDINRSWCLQSFFLLLGTLSCVALIVNVFRTTSGKKQVWVHKAPDKYQLGVNGAKIPVLGLGTWKSSTGKVGYAVKEAIRLGYRHIDCAADYENEGEIGYALAECFKRGLVKREDLFVTSKLLNTDHAPEDVVPVLRRTLADLRLNYVDLYLMHWPVAQRRDGNAERMVPLSDVPLAETWKAMEKCVDMGLARTIGVSNFSVKKLTDLMRSAQIMPAVNQVERHPYLQQRELLSYCSKKGIHVTAYSPLGSGDRPKDLKQPNEPTLLEDAIVASIARKHRVTPAQVLLRWAIESGTSVIPKSTSPLRMAENRASSHVVTLDEADMRRIAGLDRHHRYVDGTFWCMDGSPYTLENLWDEEK